MSIGVTYDKVKGRTVVAVDKKQNEDEALNDEVALVLDDGSKLRLWLDADCCSQSYYTDLRQFDELIGAKIQNVEERDRNNDDREVSWHFLVFTTDKGHATIDWRNDSNGYYDGSVCASLIAPEGK